MLTERRTNVCQVHMAGNSGEVGSEGHSGRQPITLVIPCKAEYIGLCRLVAGVVGARESLDEEVIADLKLVVTEACTCFIWGADTLGGDVSSPVTRTQCSLRVDFNVMPEAWEIIISDPENKRHLALPERCDPMSEGGLGLTIINALVDSVEQTESAQGGSVLRLVKRLPTQSGPVF